MSSDILLAFEDLDNGEMIATVHATLDSSGKALEVVPWLLGWGDSVEVLEPASIRNEMAEKLRNAASQYSPSD